MKSSQLRLKTRIGLMPPTEKMLKSGPSSFSYRKDNNLYAAAQR